MATDHQLPLELLLVGIRVPDLPRIHNRELRSILLKHRHPVPGGPGDRVSDEHEKLVYVGDNLLQALVACALHGAYPLMPVVEAKRIQATLLHSSLLGPLSRRLGCHEDSSFRFDPTPRHLANRLKAYVTAVYFDCLKDRTKMSGDAASILEMWLGAVFAHLGAKVNVDGLVEEAPAGSDGLTGGLEVHVVRTEVGDGLEGRRKGSSSVEPNEATQGDEVQILDDPTVQPSDTALANLQALRKHRVLDFHLHTLCEDQQWRTKVFGEHKGKQFSASILRSKKKTAEKVTAHLILRYLGFLGREEAVGADTASWKGTQHTQSDRKWRTKVESPVRPMAGETGKKRKKSGGSQHGDKQKDKGKKKQKYDHGGVKHEQIERGVLEPDAKLEPKVKLEHLDGRVKHQPWVTEQMDQSVMAVRF